MNAVHRRTYGHGFLWPEVLLGKGVLYSYCGTGMEDINV